LFYSSRGRQQVHH